MVYTCSKGVLTLSVTLGLVFPAEDKKWRTMLVCPLRAALWKGVSPFYSR